jgi:hypothetical protein
VDLFDAVVSFVVAAVAGSAAVTAALVWRLRRRNRVSPSVRSEAPVLWLWSPTRAARLHRRLQKAVSAARYGLGLDHGRRSRPASPQLSELVDDLQLQAVAVDRQVVVASRCPPTVRTRLLRALADQTGDIERLVERVLEAASATAGDPPPAALARMGERLDALEAARDELARLEAAAGLPCVEPSVGSAHDPRLRADPGRAPAHRRPRD